MVATVLDLWNLSLSENIHDSKTRVTKAFEKALNSHGFGFQYGVLKKIEQLFEERKSCWLFQAAEFPVSIRGRNTHIDFLLTHGRDIAGSNPVHPTTPVYMVAECKRADPALKYWCFARTPYTARNARGKRIIVERIRLELDGSSHRFRSGGSMLLGDFDLYQIGLEIKTGAKGDGSGSGRKTINDAITQAFEGLNGMVHYLFKSFQNMGSKSPTGAVLIPVIFTTARLFTTEVDISAADIESGNIELSKELVQEKPWICFQHHGSTGTKHEFKPLGDSYEISDVLPSVYARTVPIVSSSGIEKFFSQFDLDIDDLMDCK